MQGKAKIKDHPIHPMLVSFPIGFWTGSLISDILYFATDNDFWTQMGTTLMGFGIIGALAAAVFGFIDYFTAPMPMKVKRTATKHMVLNLGLTAMYSLNLYIRSRTPETPTGYALSVIAIAALMYSGWLGGDLAYEHRVGVKEEDEGKLRAAGRPAEERGRPVGSHPR
ncbi:MAG: DUF2231 domain-containing protein [Acidimicrobiia bacterium]